VKDEQVRKYGLQQLCLNDTAVSIILISETTQAESAQPVNQLPLYNQLGDVAIANNY